MKKRDIGILIGLGVVVLIAAWYFLVISPKKDDLADLNTKIESENAKYQDSQKRLKQIDQERAAARQTESDILKLDKLIPVDSQVPSLIIELQQSANDAGVQFMDIKPGTPVSGTPGANIVPFELKFEGTFFDVNDFLYRVENYARMEGTDVNVTGRLISVVTLKINEPDISGFKFPSRSSTGQVTPGHILVTMNINVYMTSPPPAKTPSAASGAATGAGGAGGTSTTSTGASAGGGASSDAGSSGAGSGNAAGSAGSAGSSAVPPSG